MRVFHFSETPYPYLPDADDYASIRVTLPNGLLDPKIGNDLWRGYLDAAKAADEYGYGVMINEHHSTATCMNPAAPVIAGILARETASAPLLVLGNPIANRRDPVRIAEEMALIDVISGGRLISGLVRGAPFEIGATNSSPARMQERFWEAHDLITKAWTEHDGAFSWQGKHFEHRQVNIWPRPFQDPHPPIWITTVNPSSTRVIAERGHVCATFLTGRETTKAIFDAYRENATEFGNPAGPDRLAYLALVYTGETDEEGLAGAEKLMWYIESNKTLPQFTNPPGYLPAPYRAKLMSEGKESPYATSGLKLRDLIEDGVVIAGSPSSVYEQIARFHEAVGGFDNLINMGQAGFMGPEETIKGLRLFSEHVLPRLQQLGAGAAVGG